MTKIDLLTSNTTLNIVQHISIVHLNEHFWKEAILYVH